MGRILTALTSIIFTDWEFQAINIWFHILKSKSAFHTSPPFKAIVFAWMWSSKYCISDNIREYFISKGFNSTYGNSLSLVQCGKIHIYAIHLLISVLPDFKAFQHKAPSTTCNEPWHKKNSDYKKYLLGGCKALFLTLPLEILYTCNKSTFINNIK